ncbi:MAG: DUF4238 domain-containing protein [Chloroflexota bacterium]|nr:DUF4238 domain-containing protein [Chloroflexota bacterium]
MSRAKKHHQVPQFYLRSFADQKERVEVYDRVTRKAFRQQVANVAVESNLYTVRDAAGEPSDAMEARLAQFEGLLSRRHAGLLAASPSLDDEDRAAVAAFVALQFVRTSAKREWLEDILDLEVRMLTEGNVGGDPPEAVERFIKTRFGDQPDWLKDEVRAVAADPTRRVALPTEEWVAGFAPLVLHVMDELLTRTWWLATAGERAFLTCDDPVTLIAWPGDPVGGVGIRTAMQILLPLAPDRVLVFEGERPGPFTVVPKERDWIRWANRSVASRATRQVFWHPKSSPMDGIQIPPAPRPTSINGIPIHRGQRSWDLIRERQVPAMHRVRDRIRAAHHVRDAGSDPLPAVLEASGIGQEPPT